MQERFDLNGTEVHRIPDDPLFIVKTKSSESDIKGWVVVHSIGAYGACGGVRLYPDVDMNELKRLARAMTYKYCFFERKIGGAKAGLQIPFDLPSSERKKVMKKIGFQMASLVRSGIYMPWTDMNSTIADIKHILEGAGIQATRIGDSSYYTSLSTFTGIKAYAEYYGIAPEKCRITIEGVGSVGYQLAMEINQWGGKIIGASTRTARSRCQSFRHRCGSNIAG
jgi:glutamate dehydrogenase (NAD(P)+)